MIIVSSSFDLLTSCSLSYGLRSHTFILSFCRCHFLFYFYFLFGQSLCEANVRVNYCAEINEVNGGSASMLVVVQWIRIDRRRPCGGSGL